MLNSILGTSITVQSFLLCTCSALVLGLLTAGLFMIRSHYSKSFAVTLAVLPVMVQLIILLVNGSIGTGVAVAGAFSLIRFRSQPGTAQEIAGVLLAMALGLAVGMGYLVIAFLFFAIVALFILLLTLSKFGGHGTADRILKITIPENLDYDGLFSDLFDAYTHGVELTQVKTTNMGSLYELSYRVKLNTPTPDKRFLDEIRTRNGNLTVLCGRETDRPSL